MNDRRSDGASGADRGAETLLQYYVIMTFHISRAASRRLAAAPCSTNSYLIVSAGAAYLLANRRHPPESSTMSNINGGMGRGGRSALSSVDFYRRVPKDLTEVRVIDFLNQQKGDGNGAFPLVMCVESWYKTAFQLEI